MKKKLSLMALSALFAVGLALHANSLNTVNKLLDSNVEALSEGENNVPNPYIVLGEYPNRIIADMIAHTLTIEGKSQAYDDKGKRLNGCVDDAGGVCVIDTSTGVVNAGMIISYVKDVLNAISAALPLIEFIVSLI